METEMDSDDSLIEIGHEEDSLLPNLPSDEFGGFACSPLVIAASSGPSRSSTTIPFQTAASVQENVRSGETGCVQPVSNKENLQEICSMKLGHPSNLSLEPQKMKRNQKAGGCNLRKSLAWDKAFFTEEGILSSLELSMITRTPNKLDGKHLPGIIEDYRTPMRVNTTPTGLQTMKSKSSRKLPFSRTKDDKRTGEGSIRKQTSVASGLKSKKQASTSSVSNSGRKEGSCLNYHTPTSHKRLPTTSPAKPAGQKNKIPRTPILKSGDHLSSTTAGTKSSDASQSKRNYIAPPAPTVWKHINQIGCSNIRSTSSSPKVASLRIPKPSKPSDQRIRKNRNDPCSREQPSTSYEGSSVKEITSSDNYSGKIYPAGLEANGGTSKAALSARANFGNTDTSGQSIPHQTAKPTGLKIPSPSLRFFSEPKVSMLNGREQRNVRVGATCNVFQSTVPKTTEDRIPDSGPAQQCSVSSISQNLEARCNAIQSKISKETMVRISDSSPAQQCFISSIKYPKVHDKLLQCKNNELTVGAEAVLDEEPLEQMDNNGLEVVDKDFVEHEHASVSIESLHGEDNIFASQCNYGDKKLLQGPDNLLASRMEKSSDSHSGQKQYDFSAMNNGHVLESEVQEYSIVCSLLVGDISQEMPNRIDRKTEVQELQSPFYVTDDVSQTHEGSSSNTKEPLKRSFSPERAFENHYVDRIMDEDETDNPLVAKGALSALGKILDSANKPQFQGRQCPRHLIDKAVQSVDGSTAEEDAFRIVNNDHKMSETLALEVMPSAFLDTKSHTEDHADPCAAEYNNETDLIGQNVDLKLEMSPTVSKSLSHADAVTCESDFTFSPASSNTKPQTEDLVDLSVVDFAHETDVIGQNSVFQQTVLPSQVDAVICDVELSSSTASLVTKLQAEDQVNLSVKEYTNSVSQSGYGELQVLPRACKSISQVDTVVCDAELLSSSVQGFGSEATELLSKGIDQLHYTFDELARDHLMTDEEKSSSRGELSSNDIGSLEEIKLRHRTNFYLSPYTIMAKPLMPDEASSEFLENEHSEDLVNFDVRELGFQAEFQLSQCTLGDQPIHATTVCTSSLGNETTVVLLDQDMFEEDQVESDHRVEIDFDHMEKLLLANKNGNETAKFSSISNKESYCLHGSVDISAPSVASPSDSTVGVHKQEQKFQMNQEPLHLSLEIEQVENHISPNDDSSSRNDKADQSVPWEPQLSPRISEDHGLSSPRNFNSTSVKKTVESDEQVESASLQEDIHDIGNEDKNTKSMTVKVEKNLPQLVIRPPADVPPFSEEWLAAVEAAGEEILTLKTGPVQNSPPAKLSPEPSPWSPVKRKKKNQEIGPYDCTKFTGQH